MIIYKAGCLDHSIDKQAKNIQQILVLESKYIKIYNVNLM